MYVVDLRGRGSSVGERFYVNDFEDYVSDVAIVVALAKSREPRLPLFLRGHSAGGVVACLYTLEHQPEIAGLIFRSTAHPAFKVDDLDRAVVGYRLLLAPYELIAGYRVAIIEDGGIPVELVQTTLTDDEI